MRNRITLFMLLCTGVLSAQIAVVTRNVPVFSDPAKIGYYYPVLSQDGKRLMYTGEDYKGLNVCELSTGKDRRITNVAGAGYEPVFGNESEEIYYREISYKSGRRYSSLYRYVSGEEQPVAVVQDVRSLKKPVVSPLGVAVIGEGQVMKSSLRKKTVSTPTVYVCIEETRLALYQDGKRTLLSPAGEDVAGYIWPSLSPDKSKILFYAAGKGSFVCDLKGNIVGSLGKISSPVWYGNDYVVGMECEDDGERFTRGRIIMSTSDGRVRQYLTDGKEIAMYPTVSSEQGRIAYNTGDGRLYLMEISLIR